MYPCYSELLCWMWTLQSVDIRCILILRALSALAECAVQGAETQQFETGSWKLFIREQGWGVTAATAAKSLQSCPTLCDSIDSSPPQQLYRMHILFLSQQVYGGG